MSLDATHYLNISLGLGAIVLQILCIIALILLLVVPNKNEFRNKILSFISKHFLLISFLVVLISTIFSLVYSEVIHFTPCYLCWFQRVFMYPLVFLFGLALWGKDRKVVRYALPLVCAGFLVSLYQNYGYYFGTNGSSVCGTSGVSCYQQFVSEFGGYISIPMLAITSFGALLVIILVVHFFDKETS